MSNTRISLCVITGNEEPAVERFLSSFAPAIAAGIHEKTFAYAVQTCSSALRYVEYSVKHHDGKTSAETAKDRLKEQTA